MKRWALILMLCVFVAAPGLCFAGGIILAQSPCSYPNVPKKDGTYDARKNDLWELAQDWVFFRNEILKKAHSGDTTGAQKARESFQQINTTMSIEYPSAQISEALEIAEKCRAGK
jgi:hypothetical protein